MKKLFILFLLSFIFGGNLRAQLIINEVLYDPSNTGLAGDANGDSLYSQTQDEFIELINTGTTPFNISGFQISDSSITVNRDTVRYVFPSNTTIPPGGAIVVFGGGIPKGLFGSAIVLADTGADGLSMANSGEVILIKDNLGNVVLRFNSDALSNNPDESYTRNPDITGAFVQHASINTKKFSPGTKVDGLPFSTSNGKLVILKVDMNELGTAFDSVFVKGNFNQWCNNCNALTDANKDGLFEINSSSFQDTLKYLFVYKSGSTFTEETLTPNSCTILSDGKNVRMLQLKSDTSLRSVCFGSCSACTNKLSLQGITDFVTPFGGVSGKGIHVRTTADIADLSSYGLGIANNGGGTDGEEFKFPKTAAASGSNILVVRDSVAMKAYLAGCWTKFNYIFVDIAGVVNQNGNDAIELFKVGEVAETYGNANEDGTGKTWEYTGSWAYKSSGNWINGALNCTDSSKTTIYDTDCIYPICVGILVSEITVSSPSSSISQNAGTLQMTATVLPANASNKSVTWSVDSSSLASISSSGLLTAKANGEVTVKAMALDGSGVFGAKKITITGQANSMAELNKVSVKIYPNPIENILNIESAESINEFKIYSMDGKLILNEKASKNQINLSELSPGAYFIEFKINDYSISHKFIKN